MVKSLSSTMLKRYEVVALFILLVFFGFFPLLVPDLYYLHLLIGCLIWAGVTCAWDLVMGYGGIFSFGQLGFFIVGAYTSGIATKCFEITPWIGILLGAAMAGLFGFGIGLASLRLRGAYIALVTFGFHMILEHIIKLSRGITGGTGGLLNVPPLPIGSIRIEYYCILVVVFLILFLIFKVIKSSLGLSFIALRDAEDLATSLGINDFKCKVEIFVISALITGLLGALYVHYMKMISYKLLGIDTFILLMLMLMVGGLGRFPATVLGVIIVTFANDFLRPLNEFRLVIFGGIMVILILFMPNGILKSALDAFERYTAKHKKSYIGDI